MTTRLGAGAPRALILGLLLAVPALALGQPAPPVGAPPARVDPLYAALPGAAASGGALPSEPPAEAQARRARVAARVGDVVITVAELEDYVAAAPRNVQDAFRSPQGRRSIVERLLRGHLLAIEAERRGATDPLTVHLARRHEERALVDLLELQIRQEAAMNDLPEPPPPVHVPEQRFAVILRTSSREVAETWRAEASRTSFQVAAERGRALGGEVQETPYGQVEPVPDAEPSIEPALWRALFQIEPPEDPNAGSTTSPVIALGRGRFAVVLLAGTSGGFEEVGPDRQAMAMLAGDAAWTAFTAEVVSRRVSFFEPTRVDGVPFRFARERSPQAMQQIAAEVQAAAEARAAAEEAVVPPGVEDGP